MSTIIGHERQRDYLNKVFARGRMAHAYIFSGPEHTGKLTIAKMFAKSFFCLAKKNRFEEICGRCASCLQIEENRYGNVFFLDTLHTLMSKKEARKDIPIEDIRELKRQFSLSSSSFGGEASKWRIVIINEAERLNGPSASAFLKLLEEPSAYALFLLITAHEEILMQTVLSRAQIVRFGLVGETDLVSYAQKYVLQAPRLQDAVRMSQGRPGILVRLANEAGFFESVEKKEKFIERLLKAPIPDILRAAEKIAEDKEKTKEAIWFLFASLRSCMLKQNIGASMFPFLTALKKVDRVQYLMETTNVNPRLALDVLFLEARKMYNISNQQPATSNQQPATSNQQPATSNQQPATSICPP